MTPFTYGDAMAANVLIQAVDDHDLATIENESRAIRELTGRDFCLVALRVADWNHDLSPWAAQAAFGDENFGDGAARTLDEILALCADDRKTYFLGGYSLAGLFALWAACQTGRFAGVAAASPSVWFPGFGEYLRGHSVKSGVVYLSLGDREEKTKNPLLATVGDRVREAESLLQAQRVKTTLEWNPGNHFRDPDLRTAKAFAWVLNMAPPPPGGPA